MTELTIDLPTLKKKEKKRKEKRKNFRPKRGGRGGRFCLRDLGILLQSLRSTVLHRTIGMHPRAGVGSCKPQRFFIFITAAS